MERYFIWSITNPYEVIRYNNPEEEASWNNLVQENILVTSIFFFFFLFQYCLLLFQCQFTSYEPHWLCGEPLKLSWWGTRLQNRRLLVWLIVWCLSPFLTVFQLYRSGQCTNPCFPGVLLTITLHYILSKPLAAFPHNYCRNNGQGRERNESVPMTIINPWKEYWPSRGSNQRPPVLKSAMLPTEPWGLAGQEVAGLIVDLVNFFLRIVSSHYDGIPSSLHYVTRIMLEMVLKTIQSINYYASHQQSRGGYTCFPMTVCPFVSLSGHPDVSFPCFRSETRWPRNGIEMLPMAKWVIL